MSSSSSSIKASALLLLAAAQLGCGQDLTSCGPSTNSAFDYQVTPTDGFDVHWSLDTAAETISVEVVSTAVAWAALGFSSDFEMIGSDAVVGLPDSSAVEEFDLMARTDSGVVVSETQDITDGSVSQDTSGTTFSFTRPLAPANKQAISGTPGDENIFLYAFGGDNDLGFHGLAPNRGSLVLDLFCGDGDGDGATVAGTPAPTGGGTPAPTGGGTPAASETSSLAPTAAADTPTAAPTMAVSGTPPPPALSMAPTTVELETGSSSSAPSSAPTGVETSTSSPTGAAGTTGSDTMAPIPTPVGPIVGGVAGVLVVVAIIVAVAFKTGRFKNCRHSSADPTPAVPVEPVHHTAESAAPPQQYPSQPSGHPSTQYPEAHQYPAAIRAPVNFDV